MNPEKPTPFDEMATTEQSARATQALDTLYRDHAAEVYRYTYAVLGNHADAEDVTQATFMNALRALERGERPAKPANWLLVIAHNLIRQRFRQQGARPTEVALEIDVPNAPSGDDTDPTVEELVAALGRIPESQREAIVMREFEGRSYAEIAQMLEITTTALETLLFRARRSLAEELANLVTCERAEQDVSRLLDGRLSRKERRRLLEHIRTCSSCARFETFQRKQRRALKGLALIPLPLSLTFFKGAHSASAAGLPTIGGATAAGVGGGAAASGGAAVGGIALAGVAAKAAAVVVAVAVAGGVTYEGATRIHVSHQPAAKTRTQAVTDRTSGGAKPSTPGARSGVVSTAGKDGTQGRSADARGRIKQDTGSSNSTPNGNNGGGNGGAGSNGSSVAGGNGQGSGSGSGASANAPGKTKDTASGAQTTSPGKSAAATGQIDGKAKDDKSATGSGNSAKGKSTMTSTGGKPSTTPAITTDTVPGVTDPALLPTDQAPAGGNANGNASGAGGNQGHVNSTTGGTTNGNPHAGS